MSKIKGNFMSLQEYLGKSVIMDSKGEYIFLGNFIAEDEEFYTLQDVDVHDHRTTTIPKDVYIIESAKYGVKPNRKQTKITRKDIISISLLEDVIQY